MSGTVYVPWALSKFPNHISQAYKIAEDLGEPKDSIESLIEFLQSVPADRIVKYGTAMSGFERTLDFTYAPVIES